MTAQTPTPRPLPPEPDYQALGERYTQITARLIHAPERVWTTGSDLNARVLQELLTSRSSGFRTDREHVHNLNSHSVVDRMNAEAAEERAQAARVEADQIRAELAARYADALREWCNDRTVSGTYRREGVELAAQWLERVAAGAAHRAAAQAKSVST